MLNVSPATVSKTQTGDASPGRVSTSRALPSSTIATAKQYANAARAGSGWASSRDAKADELLKNTTRWSARGRGSSGGRRCRDRTSNAGQYISGCAKDPLVAIVKALTAVEKVLEVLGV